MKKRSILTKITLAVLLAGGTLTGTAYALAAVYTPTKVGCFDNGTCYIVVSPPAMLPLVGWESDRSLVLWRFTTSW